MNCVVCGNALTSGLGDWHFVCPACGHESASLPVAINRAAAQGRMSEEQRETALHDLRRANNRQLIEWIAQLRPGRGRRLLEVGAGHGWFVAQARPVFDCLGLEPDRDICAKARAAGLPVVEGYFPDALAAGETFDVIVFNDVFEHLADSRAVLAAIGRRLAPDGLLVLSLPDRKGAIYRAARGLATLGYRRLFERMWQVGLPSPHLHYFDRRGLLRVLHAAGFSAERVERLPALRLRGLLARVRYTRHTGALASALLFVLAALAVPFLRLLPGDTRVVLAGRLESADAAA